MVELPSTRLLMNGAYGFRKICCGDVCVAGCVQLWFSIAITNTVFTRPAPSTAERFWACAGATPGQQPGSDGCARGQSILETEHRVLLRAMKGPRMTGRIDDAMSAL